MLHFSLFQNILSKYSFTFLAVCDVIKTGQVNLKQLLEGKLKDTLLLPEFGSNNISKR